MNSVKTIEVSTGKIPVILKQSARVASCNQITGNLCKLFRFQSVILQVPSALISKAWIFRLVDIDVTWFQLSHESHWICDGKLRTEVDNFIMYITIRKF
jgi:hypothetical protein